MAEGTLETQPQQAPWLDRTVNLAAVSWMTLTWVIVIVIAAAVRFAQVGRHALSTNEARLADEAYRFFYGQTSGPGNAIANTGPSSLLLEGLSFFLFGASDSVARFVPALLGTLMVVAILGLRGVVGPGRALGMAALMALSPTMVYISRIATHEIFVAAFTLFTLIAFLQIGNPARSDDGRRFWVLLSGIGLGLLFGSGPSSLSVLFSVVAAAVVATLLDNRPESAFRRSLAGIAFTTGTVLSLLIGLGISLIALFSRAFTDFGALAGLGETIADWGRLLSTASSPTPTQFFLLVVLLYEILVVLFAIVAASQSPREPAPSLPWSFFAVWFAVALMLFSFSSGSVPGHAIHVVLPLVLLGGGTFGELVERCDRDSLLRGRSGLLVLVLIGLLAAIFAQVIMIGRIDDAIDQSQAVFEAAATFILAIIPLTLAAFALSRSERPDGRPISIGAVILLAAAVVLGAYTLRTSVMLSFFNADSSIELLAQRTSTPAVHELVKRVTNLSRDATLTEGSAADPEGGHSLSIAIDRSVQYPYRWYFREFPEAIVVSEGQAPLTGADVVITPDEVGLPEAGYTPRQYPAINRVPGVYLAPDFGDIIRGIVLPSRWLDSVHYLLFRELSTTAEPENVTLGLTGALSNRISPDTGPFGLFEQVGAGNGRGQFNQPRGVAVTDDGEQIYVVDMGNARVQHFNANGEFIDTWGGEEDTGVSFARTDSGLGPTGVAVGPDGLIYICDTWNHRIVVLDETGRLVREFGAFADTLDAPDSSPEPGNFFGPRDIAVFDNEIYVVDTGNERVQVFALDGTFLRSWGGNGTEPSQFVEPVGIAVDSQGRVFVADSGNARISIFSNVGTPIEQWPVDAWFGNQYFEPYLAFDDAGNLYASSSATGSIEVFDPTGALMTPISEINGDVLEQPVGLEWSPQGELIVTDKGSSSAYRYVPPIEIQDDEVTGGIIGDDPTSLDTIDSASPPAVLAESTPEASPVDSIPEGSDIEASPVVNTPPSPVASPAASPQAVLNEPFAASPIASPVASPAASPSGEGNG